MIKIKIITQNSAFDDENYSVEIARILRELADRIGGKWKPQLLYDSDGFECGDVEYTGKDRC